MGSWGKNVVHILLALIAGASLRGLLATSFDGWRWTPWEIPLAGCIALGWIVIQLLWMVWKWGQDRWTAALGMAIERLAIRVWGILSLQDGKFERAYRKRLAVDSRKLDKAGVLELPDSPKVSDVFIDIDVSRLSMSKLQNGLLGEWVLGLLGASEPGSI